MCVYVCMCVYVSVCDPDSTMRNEKAKEKTAKEKPPKNRAHPRARFLYLSSGTLVLVGGQRDCALSLYR